MVGGAARGLSPGDRSEAKVNASRAIDLLHTLPRLGLGQVGRALRYKLEARIGWYERRLPAGLPYCGPFWHAPAEGLKARDDLPKALREAICARAGAVSSGRLTFFSAQPHDVGFPPAWRRPPGAHEDWPLVHWSRVAEFSSGDIKLVWEPSRFDGLVALAGAAVMAADASQRQAAFDRCGAWIGDWVASNPWNLGPNWRCAQETALRMLNAWIADRLLRASGADHAPALERFFREHCARIGPTMHYAMAQDNNHATSEAIGLYVGGAWLQRHARDTVLRRSGERWRRLGRVLFERLVARLVMADGSFAQHSVNYHRLFLDSACLLEIARRDAADEPLSALTVQRLAGAAAWLAAFADPETGDAPNLGANDGARLLQLSRAVYRDFRPHAQLAVMLFSGQAAWCASEPNATNDLWRCFQLAPAEQRLSPAPSRLYLDGGYALLTRGDVRVFLRLPIFRFRPSHADLLHLDLWWRGRNIVRDGGTFSYNTVPPWQTYFPGAAAHSGVQFGDRDPMPRLSRFLFGRWPSPSELLFDAEAAVVACAFRDYLGGFHRREVRAHHDRLEMFDEVASGPADPPAVLRLRLEPGSWHVGRGGEVLDASGHVVIRAQVDGAETAGLELTTGWESRAYGQRTEVPVVECRLKQQAARVSWNIELC